MLIIQNQNKNFGNMQNLDKNFGLKNSNPNFRNMQNPNQNFGNIQNPNQNFGNMKNTNQNYGNIRNSIQNYGNMQNSTQIFVMQNPNQNFENIQNSSNENSNPSTNLKTNDSISIFQKLEDSQSDEYAYSYVLRCCLFPFNQNVTDFYCNQVTVKEFKDYIYKKKISGINGISLKQPKLGYNNIDSINKYLYSLSLQNFYEKMNESSYFKDYLIFFVRITYFQIKQLTSTYRLTDKINDSLIIESIDSFVKFFKEFASKKIKNFNESRYNIFQKKVYFSFITSYLKLPSNINMLEADNAIQNWAKEVFEMDQHTHERIVNFIKRTINHTVSNKPFYLIQMNK